MCCLFQLLGCAILIYIAGTMTIVPMNAWGAELSPVYHQRSRVSGARVVFGLAGTPNHADYCASKFAVKGLTEALMVELMETPIQVHLLHPACAECQNNITG